MDLRQTPLVLPALALAAGTLLAPRLTQVSFPGLLALVGLGLALRHPVARMVAFVALGLLNATVRWQLPLRELQTLDLGRPVEIVAVPVAPWTTTEEGWTGPAQTRRIGQDNRVVAIRLPVLVDLPGIDPPPPLGAHLRLKGYLRRSPGFANEPPVPPGPWRLRLKSRKLMALEAPPGPLARLSGAFRSRVEKAMSRQGGDSPGRLLARALVLGEAGALPEAWRRGLRQAGLSHLLAVSGLHVGLLAATVLLLTFWLPRTPRLLCTLAAVGVYLLLVGPRPSLLRASIMALLATGSLLAHRPPSFLNALSWVLFVLLLASPRLVADLGFQLTMAATAGIVGLAPALTARWTALPRWFARPLAATAGAQLFTLPWALPVFHLLSPLAPLLNLVAIPWTALLLLVAFLWVGVGSLAPEWAEVLLPLLDVLAAPFSWPSATSPGLWWAILLAGHGGVPWILAVGLAWALWRPKWLLLGLLAFGLWQFLSGSPPPREVEVVVLDVGQGDAILLRDGERAILVDGGGWRRGDLGGRVLLPALAGQGIRRLHAIILTHPDRDHCGGLVEVAQYLPVREVWTAPGWPASGCVVDLFTLPGVRLRLFWKGEKAHLGRWRFTVLHPPPGTRYRANERSLVLLAEALGHRLLLTGDVEAAGERALVEGWGGELQSGILKVAHHGSKSSTTPVFLDASRPRLALISAGIGNLYGHPAPVVLQRLAERRIRVLRTDRDGMIRLELRSDGSLRVRLPAAPR